MHLFNPLPQLLKNVRLNDKSQAAAVLESDSFKKMCADVERKLKGTGRLLIRVSGTEPLIRIMLEGEDKKQIQDLAQTLADAVEKEVCA